MRLHEGFNTLDLLQRQPPSGLIVVTSSYKVKSVQWSNSHPTHTQSRAIPLINATKSSLLETRNLVSRSIFCNGTLPPPRFPLRKLINCETDSTPVESTSWLIIRSNELMAGRNNSHAYSIHRQIDGRVNGALAAVEYCYWMQTALHWLNIWLGECQRVFFTLLLLCISCHLQFLFLFCLINRVLDLLLELNVKNYVIRPMQVFEIV